jgi:hypothetical protein
MLYESIDDTDGIPFDQTIEWVCDSLLHLREDHPARIPGLINCVLHSDGITPHKLEMWIEAAPHVNQPAAYLFTVDPESGDWVEDTTDRIWFSGDLSTDVPRKMRMSSAPNAEFMVELLFDHGAEPPWESDDGRGPVRHVHANAGLKYTDAKRPGERVLFADGRGYLLYDWQAACKAARRDGWNAPPYDAPGRVERAVKADFERLRAYLFQHWWYVGVTVSCDGEKDSLWHVESDDDAGIQSNAIELAKQVAPHHLSDLIHAQLVQNAEHAERLHWEQRDVPTYPAVLSTAIFPHI